MQELRSIPDEELLERLSILLRQSRRVEADLVAHIGEVDARRLYVRQACSSMFVYTTDVLHLSEHEAYERITAARAARKHPMLLEMLRDGRLHLSGIGKLAPHLRNENCETLLARSTYKSKRQIEELLVEMSPRPDVPSVVRKLPDSPSKASPQLPVGELGPDRVVSHAGDLPKAQPLSPPAVRPTLQPLAPSRYKVTFTASGELQKKLTRLQALMHSDLAEVIEAAVTEKLERLTSKRFGKTSRPRKSVEETDTAPDSRYIPAPIRRAVCERDSDQCTFVEAQGRRCPERECLEFHHRSPYGRDGDHSIDNISLLCKIHNLYLAELDYGRALMENYREPARSR